MDQLLEADEIKLIEMKQKNNSYIFKLSVLAIGIVNFVFNVFTLWLR